MIRGGLLGLLTGAALLALAMVAPAAYAQGPPFRIVQVGDSFASGEGAPDVAGHHNEASGALIGNPDVWDPTLQGSESASAEVCHRSPRAGTAVAARRLAADFPRVDVQFRSFACSGAQITEGLLENYTFKSHDTRRPAFEHSEPPQVRRLENFRNAVPDHRIHALVVGIGGNDANFRGIVKRCFNLGFARPCNRDGTLDHFREGFAQLAPRFARLRDALEGLGPERVFLTGYPNFTSDENGDPCDNDRRDDNLVDNLVHDESVFASTLIFHPLSEKLEALAEHFDWTYVSVDESFAGHGICAERGKNWINTSHEALARQGEDSSSSGVGGANVAVSSGFAHPNYTGYQHGYGDPVYDALRRHLIRTFTLTAETRPLLLGRELDSEGRTVLRLGFETSAPVPFAATPRVLVLREDGSTLMPPQQGSDVGLPLSLTLPEAAPQRVLLRVAACPRALDAPLGCSPLGPVRPVSLVAPPAVSAVKAAAGRPQSAPAGDGSPALTITWGHGGSDDLRRFGVALLGGGRTITREVGPLLRATVVDGLVAGTKYDVQVIACADFDCAPAQPATGVAGSGRNDIEASTTPLAIGRADIHPRRLRARPGHAFQLEASWEHPLNWNQIARVELRMRSGTRSIARVLFRRDARRQLTTRGPIALLRAPDPRPGLLARKVTFPLTLRAGRDLAGRQLTVDVVAGDGFDRQLVRGAGRITVARRASAGNHPNRGTS